MPLLSALKSDSSGNEDSTANLLRTNVNPFHSVHDCKDALSRAFDTFGDCKVLLIGDASHGTSEFYAVRAEITKHMILHHEFNIVAVEADWPDAESVDRYVRRRQGPGPVGDVEPASESRRKGREPAFMRFPTWMWRNQEVQQFVEWLRDFNDGRDVHDAVSFNGLDLYSLGTSMAAIIEYLDHIDPQMAEIARERYGQLMLWAEDPHEYGYEIAMKKFQGYEREVVQMLRDLLARRVEYSDATWNGEEFHGSEQNAQLVVDAEHYYKSMYYGRDETWNLRDTHMFRTLSRLLKHRGPKSKAVVWAHNSHIGDARATSMGWAEGELSIGQLCKEAFGKQALSIGCGTNTGTVAAANQWDGDMQVKNMKPGLPGSVEELMHDTGISNFALDLRQDFCSEMLRQKLRRRRLERFIGVIYRPETERQSHYSTVILPDQFDGFLWFDKTRHVGSLEVHQPQTKLEFGETWPFGL
ncbi:uncharacterized protein JN550_012394 [Neoarthrinium moseri]|uniref:uncharacterized protein n=1 Tax=Neoarthrinium moseri TaxID=1658444 RepID=UPI001FDD9508|nr:uncharacterized protein JN550_012394 [Neoarthrinium moseri]KAI1858832.1 hypothetical protein JN550_012394 [Neoarthrinium moseri]